MPTPNDTQNMPSRRRGRGISHLRRLWLLALIACAATLAGTSTAVAGTYPEYQCSASVPSVSSGWSVYGNNTDADTVLWNTCSSGGSIGDYVSSEERAGAVTENGKSGSQVVLALDVPGSVPDVSIKSITAEVLGSPVTGDDAYLGFSAAGQTLPGAVELPYGGSEPYAATDSWTLPQGARDFESFTTCSTSGYSPTCYFADSTLVPALTNITLTLLDNTPPAVTSVSGPLASAAAANATITGSQALSFSASDESGVRSATLTLTPQGGGSPYTHTFDFSGECSYSSWNACPVSQAISGYAVNSSALKDDTYAVELSVTDAAGNTTSQELGTISIHNAPTNTTPPTILVPSQITIGTPLTTLPGGWSAPSEAGAVTYSYQWQQCDSQGNNCQAIAGAQNPTYTPVAADAGHTLRLAVTAADNDGSATATSNASPAVLTPESPLNNPAPTAPASSSTPATSGTPTTPMAGTPNGTPASETATLHLSQEGAITRPYTHSALKLTGRLATGQGQPIANATLDILQQIADTNTTTIIGHATTTPAGAFTLTVPAGPSRRIEVAYRALSTDTSYTATAEIHETVSAVAQLKITKATESPVGTIGVTVKVRGPIPPQGTIVALQVHYRGHWDPVRIRHTNSHGEFHFVYQFQEAIGSFPFLVEIPSGQANYPYSTGFSNTIDITTR
jgi:hypothetical protein